MKVVDIRAAKSRFARQAHRSVGRSRICALLGARLADRLDLINVPAGIALDIGCGAEPGADLRGLGNFPAVVGADLCAQSLSGQGMLAAANAEQLPFADRSFALVWSCLLLPWCADPIAALAETRRVLAEGGLFALCTLGPGSLGELRAAFAGSPNTQGFIDMHDLGDLLLGADFADPVLDCDVISVQHDSVQSLFAELRETGVLAVPGMSKGLRGKKFWGAACAALEVQPGGVRTTLEAVFAHAWAAPQRPAQPGGNWRRMVFSRSR